MLWPQANLAAWYATVHRDTEVRLAPYHPDDFIPGAKRSQADGKLIIQPIEEQVDMVRQFTDAMNAARRKPIA